MSEKSLHRAVCDREIWKDIAGYENLYQVSNLGNVRSLHFNNTPKIQQLKPCKRNAGYFCVNLSKEGKALKYNIHRLVAIAFIPNQENKKIINHIDGIKSHNLIDNLEWVTHAENEYHAQINKLKASGEKHGMAKLTELQVRDIRKINSLGLFSRKQISEVYNMTPESIGNILNNKNWK